MISIFVTLCAFNYLSYSLLFRNELYHSSPRLHPAANLSEHINAIFSPLPRYAWCETHKKMCDTSSAVAMMNIAGVVCVAHSSMGAQEREKALSFAHFIIWCGIRRLLQEPILIHECVDTFPRDIIEELLPMYDWSWSLVSPHQHGWPIKRLRQWAVARHKVKTLAYSTMLNIFTSMFTRQKTCDWQIFFWENLNSIQHARLYSNYFNYRLFRMFDIQCLDPNNPNTSSR